MAMVVNGRDSIRRSQETVYELPVDGPFFGFP